MDLNKDSQNIYTVDANSYTEYMHDNWEKPTSTLNSFIKILLVILLLVMGYFFYIILKDDLSFSEVFNKKELNSAYATLVNDQNSDQYVEVLAQETFPEKKESKKEKVEVAKVEVATLKTDEVKKELPPVANVTKNEVKTVEKIEIEKVEKPIVKEEKKQEEKVEIEEVETKKETIAKKETVAKEVTVKVTPLKEESTSEVLSESYLDRVLEELNSN